MIKEKTFKIWNSSWVVNTTCMFAWTLLYIIIKQDTFSQNSVKTHNFHTISKHTNHFIHSALINTTLNYLTISRSDTYFYNKAVCSMSNLSNPTNSTSDYDSQLSNENQHFNVKKLIIATLEIWINMYYCIFHVQNELYVKLDLCLIHSDYTDY
jgi:hypothetical protein